MDPNALKRDAKRIHAALKKTSGNQLVTPTGCKIYIPVRFAEQGLATIGSDVIIVGICAYTVDDKYYGVSLVNAMMRLSPTTINTVTVMNEDYYEFIFDPGAVVTPNVDLVKDDTLPYRVYNEIFAKGRVPWYMSYEDLGRIYESAGRHANLNVGANHAVVELMAAAICRDQSNLTRYYRHVVKSEKDLVENPPAVTKLKDVGLGATNTTAKLLGSYFTEGLTSALINPSDRKEPIETLLRQ